jgi:hypothetical protein
VFVIVEIWWINKSSLFFLRSFSSHFSIKPNHL